MLLIGWLCKLTYHLTTDRITRQEEAGFKIRHNSLTPFLEEAHRKQQEEIRKLFGGLPDPEDEDSDDDSQDGPD